MEKCKRRWLRSRLELGRMPCHGRLCHTVDQCCREIIDESFSYKEWDWFFSVGRFAMLEVSND